MTATPLLEFLDFGFNYQTARRLVDSGYVLRPGRFHTRGSSVAPACIPAKAAHDGYPRGLGRPALAAATSTEVIGR